MLSLTPFSLCIRLKLLVLSLETFFYSLFCVHTMCYQEAESGILSLVMAALYCLLFLLTGITMFFILVSCIILEDC